MSLIAYLTDFGDPYLTVPLSALILGWIATTHSLRAAALWSGGIGIGAALVAASRIAHVAWGVEIAAWHFTVVSGHAMLASAVYPTALALCDNRGPGASRSAPYLGGLGFAAAIGASRVLLGYHSPIEVISGLLSGGLVAMLMRARLAVVPSRFAKAGGVALPDPARFAAAALAAVVMYHGRIAPVSASIDRDAERIVQWGTAPAARSAAARPDAE
ncbi:phosphatase PAP2 family protein [Burkholderia plantarii]|uniref:Phosphatidic acid phosphatase type 2 haloperoxidase n=1 Tax=Burkholderia plantarii TaxID=41899 RepID=A0A0B6S6D2_BURPL|nr:phosphatase PAP2 family protein [Burkholderia plantarii]AJK49989.1 phosphatidic acid phosphatase type 2 haloperoxidase [Burkholderia plantarii]